MNVKGFDAVSKRWVRARVDRRAKEGVSVCGWIPGNEWIRDENRKYKQCQGYECCIVVNRKVAGGWSIRWYVGLSLSMDTLVMQSSNKH